jgi:cell division transport system ATP-binding protein
LHTLLQPEARLQPEIAEAPLISFQGVSKTYLNGTEALRAVDLDIPRQDFVFLVPKLTVFENVEFALRVTRGVDRLTRAKVEEVLAIVGLEGQERKFPDELSGGQQQRVAIARALSHDPKIFIADEPTGNLDPATSWEILQLLLQINTRGATVVMATHNKEIVDVMRRRVVVVNNGNIVRDDASGGYHGDVQ